MINLEEHKSIETHWRALYLNGNNVKYFDRFWVEYVPDAIKKLKRNKNITTTIYRKQAKLMNQKCTDNLVLDLLILCWLIKE